MKTILYTSLILIALGACRSAKNTRKIATKSQRTQVASHKYQVDYAWRTLDSTGRYWYYGTDSSFYFHPDGGLSGIGGRLWVQESTRGEYFSRYFDEAASIHVSDSLVAHLEEHLEAKPHHVSKYTVLLIVAIGVVLLYYLKGIWA